jgi:flavin reductase (DIM6/NTAB) family NADH-FMN oxidoreductase RutF
MEAQMSIDKNELRRIMGHFATGVTVITTISKDGTPYGLTANAFMSVSLEPPLLLISVDKKAESYPYFEESRVFTINILRDDQESLSRRFAVSGGISTKASPTIGGQTMSRFLTRPWPISSASCMRLTTAAIIRCIWARYSKPRPAKADRCYFTAAATVLSPNDSHLPLRTARNHFRYNQWLVRRG